MIIFGPRADSHIKYTLVPADFAEQFRTPFASCLSEEQAKERLRELNRQTYAARPPVDWDALAWELVDRMEADRSVTSLAAALKERLS